MKKYIFLGVFAFWGFLVNAQDADKVLGLWLTSNGKYNGDVAWLKEPNRDGKPKTDYKNPDEKLRSRPTLGLSILSGFEYDAGDKEWQEGTIYDPKEGKTYKCIMWFDKDPNVLHVKGYIGFSFIGKEVTWTKEK